MPVPRWRPPAPVSASQVSQAGHAEAGGSEDAGAGAGAPSLAASSSRGSDSAVSVEEVEMEVMTGSGAAAVGRPSPSCDGEPAAAAAAGEPEAPSLVVIEDPTGNIYIGMDRERWEKEVEEQRQNAPQPRMSFDDQLGGSDVDSFGFGDEHHIALVARRRSGCLFLLAMDVAYLVFLSIVPIISPERYDGDDLAGMPLSDLNTTDPLEFNQTGNYTLTNTTLPDDGPSSGMGLIEKTLIEIGLYMSVDALGIIACLKNSPSLLTVFVALLSCVTVLTAVAALSPVLVFRMIIIMLALQLRSGLLLLRPGHQRQQGMLARARDVYADLRRRWTRRAAAPGQEQAQGGPGAAGPAAAQPPANPRSVADARAQPAASARNGPTAVLV